MIVYSLFDGGSCGYQALKDAGIKVDKYYASEIDDKAIKISEHNHKDIIRLGDVKNWNDWDVENVDLVIGGSPCFAAGTKVITDNGYKNIEDVKKGDMVLTHNNRYRKVLRTGGQTKKIYILKAQGIKETLTTENHPYYVRSYEYNGCKRKLGEPIWKKVGELQKGDFVGLPIIKEEKNPYNLTDEDCWLLGRYVADGHYRKDKRKDRNNSFHYQVIYSVGSHKLDVFNHNVKRNFSCYPHSKSVHRCVVSSKRLVELIENNNFGKGALNKKIPNLILELPVALANRFLDGYLSGDGNIRNTSIRANSVSEELIMGLNLLIAKVYKVNSSFELNKRPKTHVIEGRIVNQNDIYVTEFRKDMKKQSRAKVIDDIIWLPVKEVIKTNEESRVYNLEVEEDNSYTANNAIVHNCQGFSRQGKGLNFDDPRSKLFFEFAAFLEKVKIKNPEVKFLLENVNMKKEWENVITEYMAVEPVSFNSDLLLPQNRPRTYWTNIDFELPKHNGNKLLDILESVNLHDFVEKEGIKIDKSFSKESIDLVNVVNGEVRISQAVKKGYIEANPGDGINISFPTSKTRRGRVVKGRSSCLDTSCDIGLYDDNGQIRRFTITELERLQGLPDGYTSCVDESAAKKFLGNGWTVDVIAHIFKGLKQPN